MHGIARGEVSVVYAVAILTVSILDLISKAYDQDRCNKVPIDIGFTECRLIHPNPSPMWPPMGIRLKRAHEYPLILAVQIAKSNSFVH